MAPPCLSRLLPPRPGASAASDHAQPRTAWPGTKHPPDTNKTSNPQRLLAMGPMPSPLPNRGWPWARTTLRKTAIALWTVLHTPTRVPPTSRGRGDRLGRGTRLCLLPPRGGSLFLSPFPRVLGRTLRSRNATREAPPLPANSFTKRRHPCGRTGGTPLGGTKHRVASLSWADARHIGPGKLRARSRYAIG